MRRPGGGRRERAGAGPRARSVTRRAPAAALLLVAAAAALLGAPNAAEAQSLCPAEPTAEVAPTFLRDGEGRRAAGAGFAFEGCRSEHDLSEAFSRTTYAGGGLRGVVPLTSRVAVPQNVEASLQGGISMSLSRRRPVTLDDDPDTDLYEFNHGFAAAGARLQYEASSDFREQALAGGAELRWVDPRRPLLPSVLATWDFVKPARSRVRDATGAERDVHGRLGLRGYWLVPLPARLHLEVDGSYFRSFGLEEDGNGETVGGEAAAATGAAALPVRGRFAATTLGYGLARPLGPLRIESIFVGYARGRLPTGTEGREAWTLGAEIEVRR